MAITRERTLSSQKWRRFAQGPSDVIITPADADIIWVVTNAITEPTLESGHIATQRRNMVLSLSADEYFWAKGRGRIALTAENGLD